MNRGVTPDLVFPGMTVHWHPFPKLPPVTGYIWKVFPDSDEIVVRADSNGQEFSFDCLADRQRYFRLGRMLHHGSAA